MYKKLTVNKKAQYGIVIAILMTSFLVSFTIRMQPTNYGWELDEFDPYFNYRATQYMLDNGYDGYLEWHDDRSWYPQGRDISATSQVALHWTAASLYKIFEPVTDLYHFTILLPAVFGSLTVFIFFALGRVMVDTRVGVLCALFFAMAVPFIQRGTAGWFKSEPLGIFFGLLALYLFVSAVRYVDKDKLNSIVRILGAGAFMAFGLSAWGGTIFFLIPVAIWIVFLPLVMKQQKLKHMLWLLPIYTISLVSISLLFDRPTSLVFGIAGAGIFGPLVLLVIFQAISKAKSHWNKNRNFLLSVIILGIIFGGLIMTTPFGDSGNSRYINVFNPFSIGSSPLTQSVAEHQVPSFNHIFERTVFMFIFTPLGIIAIVRKYIPKETMPLVLSIGFLGMYVGTSYVRLELFMSAGMILFASIGIMWLFDKFTKKGIDTKRVMMFSILLVAMIVPAGVNWAIMLDRAPIIMTAGSYIADSSASDWLETLEWLKNNTPDDAVVLAWWDYGYWLETKANKITVMDNAAFHEERIVKMAGILTSSSETAYLELKEEGIDYVVITTTGHKINDYYILGYGGDLSKMGWIMKIAGKNMFDYKDNGPTMYPDYNATFWDDTISGRMIPFAPVELDAYEKTMMTEVIGETSMPFYQRAERTSDLMELVHISPSFYDHSNGPKYVVSVYKVN
jgi:dolichyl-diphosphooligosaccharide--protein glycosyltransferase